MITIKVDESQGVAAVEMLREGGATVERLAGGTIHLTGVADAAAARAMLDGLADRATASDLALAKAQAHREMIAWIDRLTARVRAGYAADEVASWPAKALQARAVLAGDPPGTLLTVEAAARGIEVEELASMVDGHATRMETIIGQVAGLRGVTAAAIEAAGSAAEIDAILSVARESAAAEAAALNVDVPEALS